MKIKGGFRILIIGSGQLRGSRLTEMQAKTTPISGVKVAVAAFFQEVLGKQAFVTTVQKDGEAWRSIVELVEEKGMMDDLLGVYEVMLDDDMNVTSYHRRGLRRRSDISAKPWEE